MVTWPDYWASTIAPEYYLISQMPVPPVTMRATTEAGEILISKASHPFTLLLATYYNFYGPTHYFRLLSQGAPGEGDKDTFIQAAAVVGEKFYTTVESVKPLGHASSDGIAGSAMVQFDPRQDQVYQTWKKEKDKKKGLKEPKHPGAFFIHAHFPKFNPATVFDDGGTKPTRGPDGKSWSRAFLVPEDVVERFGYDAERGFWEEIRWVACTLEGKFKSWEGKSGICETAKEYWRDVFESPGRKTPKFVS
jgi:alpha 1,2-mannosyltransferase